MKDKQKEALLRELCIHLEYKGFRAGISNCFDCIFLLGGNAWSWSCPIIIKKARRYHIPAGLRTILENYLLPSFSLTIVLCSEVGSQSKLISMIRSS